MNDIASPQLFRKHSPLVKQIRERLYWLRNRHARRDPPTVDEKETFRLIDLAGLSSNSCSELMADRAFSRVLADQPVLAAPENALDSALALLCKMGGAWSSSIGTVVIAPRNTNGGKILDICLRRLFENFLQYHPREYEGLLVGKRALLLRAAGSSMRCAITGLTPDGHICKADHPAKHPLRLVQAFQCATIENFPIQSISRKTSEAEFPAAHLIVLTTAELAETWGNWKAAPAKRRAE